VDVVEFLREDPLIFCVVYFELQVCRNAETVSNMRRVEIYLTHYSGWMSERSVPITRAEG